MVADAVSCTVLQRNQHERPRQDRLRVIGESFEANAMKNAPEQFFDCASTKLA